MSYLYNELPEYDGEYKTHIFNIVNKRFEPFNEYNLPFSINKKDLSNEELIFCIKCANELPEFFRHVMLYVSVMCRECRKLTPNAWCDSCPTLEILQHMDYLESVFGLIEYAQPDGYHLLPEGYAAWVSYLRTHVAHTEIVTPEDPTAQTADSAAAASAAPLAA